MATERAPELVNNILTSWIPLTTQVPLSPYPSSCNSAFRLETISESVTNIVAYDPWFGQAIDTSARDCLAAEQTQWWAQQNAPSTVFNLGPFACPTPYTTATVSSVNSDTTMIACCPSNYSFQGSIFPPLTGRQCYSSLSVGQVIAARTGTIGNSTWLMTTATVTATSVGVWGNQMNGFIFADDAIPGQITATTISSSSPSFTPAIGSNPQTSIPIATGVPTITSTPATSNNRSQLRLEVSVGLGAGLVSICCLVAFILFWRRRAQNPKAAFVELGSNGPTPRSKEISRPKLVRMGSTSADKHFEADSKEIMTAVEMWAPSPYDNSPTGSFPPTYDIPPPPKIQTRSPTLNERSPTSPPGRYGSPQNVYSTTPKIRRYGTTPHVTPPTGINHYPDEKYEF